MDNKLCMAGLLMFSLLNGCVLLGGCATEQNTRLSQKPQEIFQTTPLDTVSQIKENPITPIQQAAYQSPISPTLDLTESTAPQIESNEQSLGLSLASFEEMALSNNPTLVQAAAQIEAANGAAYQAGLIPNPFVGYEGEFNNVGGAPDENWNGGFISQEIVTADKLKLSRAKWQQRASIAETNFQTQQYRILNDIRSQFYRTLAAQNLVDIYSELLSNGEDSLQTVQEMLNLGQASQSELLRSEIGLQQDRLNLKQANFELDNAWHQLASMAGVPDLVRTSLTGLLDSHKEPLDWDSALSLLLSSSPEIQAALQKIHHDNISVRREEAEPIPNLIAAVTTIHSRDANTTQTTFNMGISLPVFDRNQGTIQQAQSDLKRSHAEQQRLELELRTRLASQYLLYRSAWQRIQDYNAIILPKAKKSYDLLHKSYQNRRAAWPDVLAAQRLHLNFRKEHIGNLTAYYESDVAIRGMLLTGGLTEPMSPVGGGHIDAVPKPR